MNALPWTSVLVTTLVTFVASVLASLLTERRFRPIPAALGAIISGVAVTIARARLADRGRPVAPRVERRGGRAGHWSPFPGRPPSRRELKRVIPIAQRQTHDATDVTLLALEAYADGFVVTGQVLWPAEAEQWLQRGGGHPWFTLTATDDLGTPYAGGPSSSGGSADQWRFECSFSPAIPPSAREMTLELAEIVWEHFDPELGEAVIDGVLPGPWRFTVPLA